MIYIRALFHKYQLFIVIALLLIFQNIYQSSEFNNLIFFKYSLFLIILSFVLLIYRKLYRLKQFEPLKLYLDEMNIGNQISKENQLTLSLILSSFVLILLYLWLDLSINGSFQFFISSFLIFIVCFIFLYDKIRLYDKLLNVLFLIILNIVFVLYSSISLFKYNLDTYNIFDFIIFSFILISYIIFDDMKKIYIDHQIDKNTIVRKIGIEKSKKIVLIFGILIYVTFVLKTILVYNPAYLFPMFSMPIYINILLRIHKLNQKEFKNVSYLFNIYILFVNILIVISNLFASKFNF